MNPKAAGLKVCSLNVKSLRCHIEDVKSDPALLQSDILCLQEIWLHPGEEEGEQYQLPGFHSHFTCVGPGKGVAVYVKDNITSYSYQGTSEPLLQLGRVSLPDLDIITIYRSQEEPPFRAAHFLQESINLEKTTLVIGDFNLCPRRKPDNDLNTFLSGQMFRQLVTLPTHVDGGTFSYLKMSRGQIALKCRVTPWFHSYLQVSWTKLTFASQRRRRWILKWRPGPITIPTMTAYVLSSDRRWALSFSS